MCWAAADRMTRIAQKHVPVLMSEFAQAAGKIRREILTKAVHPERGSLVADYGGREVDAALLQAITLRLLPANESHAMATVQAILADLDDGGWLKRYRTDDGFGTPDVAFSLCTFWLVEALARLGLDTDARAALDRVRNIKSPLGLLSEDVKASSGEMWGNFPQAYSHVGLIHAAFAAAPRWGEYGS
jgi:GH15 family glucan-1,4-alpha-glucosidase